MKNLHALHIGLLSLWFVIAPLAQGADDLGRLLYTREQRAAIDMQQAHAPPDAQGSTVRLDGILHRERKPSLFWTTGPAPDLPLSRGKNAAEAQLKTGVGPLPLRVGESANRSSGERYDILEGGAIRIHRTVRP